MEITLDALKAATPEEATEMLVCIARGLLGLHPEMNEHDLMQNLFITVIRLHVGEQVMKRMDGPVKMMYMLEPTGKKAEDQEIISAVDDEVTPEIRYMVGLAARLAKTGGN